MTGDNQHQPKTADEILETEEEAMIRFAIERSLRQDAAEHALVWLEKVSSLIAVLAGVGRIRWRPQQIRDFDRRVVARRPSFRMGDEWTPASGQGKLAAATNVLVVQQKFDELSNVRQFASGLW
jgi:hypothetical protein